MKYQIASTPAAPSCINVAPILAQKARNFSPMTNRLTTQLVTFRIGLNSSAICPSVASMLLNLQVGVSDTMGYVFWLSFILILMYGIMVEQKLLYNPNADIRTRYRSKVYSEQCVQSKHREITNYYIGTTVAFIACYISDLIFLEGQICILTNWLGKN